jgi:hypothetical protein
MAHKQKYSKLSLEAADDTPPSSQQLSQSSERLDRHPRAKKQHKHRDDDDDQSSSAAAAAGVDDVRVNIVDSPMHPRSDESPFLAASSPAASSQDSGGGNLSTTSSIDGDESTELVSHEDDEEGQQQHGSSSGSTRKTGTVAGLVVLDEDPPSEGEIVVTLMRLGGSGLGNIQLNVPLDWQVKQLVARVYERELAERKRVRIFFSGRMLQNEEQLGAAGVADGCVLHSHLLPPLEGDEGAGDGAAAGAHGDGEQEHGSGEPRGEVLLDGGGGSEYHSALAGYSPAQLELMRQAQMQMDLEMQMIQAAGAGGAREGSNGELLLGFAIGFILGWLSILWLYSPSLSRKQRLGIMLGLTLNLVMLLLNGLDPAQQQQQQQQAQQSSDGSSSGDPPPAHVDPREGAEGVINSR